MAFEVRMPQLGESITEGTVVRWLKRPGDRVERDEPLLEISTDKVDSEIPSPAAGWVAEIVVAEGDTVPVHTPVCRLADAPVSSGAGERPEETAGSPNRPGEEARAAERKPSGDRTSETSGGSSLEHARATTASRAEVRPEPTPGSQSADPRAASRSTARDADKLSAHDRLSPAVRRLARDHKVDLSRIRGTGEGGRITRRDVESFLARGPTVGLPPGAVLEDQTRSMGPGDRIEPLSVMRRQIAEHMVESVRAAPHVATVHEVDLTAIGRLRDKLRAATPGGPRWTWLAFILHAVARSLRQYSALNASLADGRVHYHAEVRLGVAVALDQGLIVPVIRRADHLSVRELAVTIEDIAERARSRRLHPEETHGATFTVTNPGVWGTLIGTPIIPRPQAGCLCIGAVKKRVVVVGEDDALAVRSLCYLSLSFDHRLIDGETAGRFLSDVGRRLEDTDVRIEP